MTFNAQRILIQHFQDIWTSSSVRWRSSCKSRNSWILPPSCFDRQEFPTTVTAVEFPGAKCKLRSAGRVHSAIVQTATKSSLLRVECHSGLHRSDPWSGIYRPGTLGQACLAFNAQRSLIHQLFSRELSRRLRWCTLKLQVTFETSSLFLPPASAFSFKLSKSESSRMNSSLQVEFQTRGCNWGGYTSDVPRTLLTDTGQWSGRGTILAVKLCRFACDRSNFCCIQVFRNVHIIRFW